MIRTRSDFIKAIGDATASATREEIGACIEALLLVAATKANAMSPYTDNVSTAHIIESATAMLLILNDTFGIEV